jgi:hypothetical protein
MYEIPQILSLSMFENSSINQLLTKSPSIMRRPQRSNSILSIWLSLSCVQFGIGIGIGIGIGSPQLKLACDTNGNVPRREAAYFLPVAVKDSGQRGSVGHGGFLGAGGVGVGKNLS